MGPGLKPRETEKRPLLLHVVLNFFNRAFVLLVDLPAIFASICDQTSQAYPARLEGVKCESTNS